MARKAKDRTIIKILSELGCYSEENKSKVDEILEDYAKLCRLFWDNEYKNQIEEITNLIKIRKEHSEVFQHSPTKQFHEGQLALISQIEVILTDMDLY